MPSEDLVEVMGPAGWVLVPREQLMSYVSRGYQTKKVDTPPTPHREFSTPVDEDDEG